MMSFPQCEIQSKVAPPRGTFGYQVTVAQTQQGLYTSVFVYLSQLRITKGQYRGVNKTLHISHTAHPHLQTELATDSF